MIMAASCLTVTKLETLMRTKFEKAVDIADDLLEQIADQFVVVRKSLDAVSDLHKNVVGDLKKGAGMSDDLIKLAAAVTETNLQIDRLKKLQERCREAQEKAKALMPEFAALAKTWRDAPAPEPSRFSIAGKAETRRPFEPAKRQAVVDYTALADVQLSRRFNTGD
jgi:hypothetical protein